MQKFGLPAVHLEEKDGEGGGVIAWSLPLEF